MCSAQRNEELNDSLRRLVLETRAGDQKAYHTLLITLTPLLRRMVYRFLSSGSHVQAAEDIVQETLLAIHLKLPTYDVRYPFLAWGHVVLKHKMIDYIRRNNMPMVSVDDPFYIEEPGAEPPHDMTAKRDLDTLLSHLKPPAGDIIYGLKVEGASIKELARTYGLSEGNIKVIVHRGLQKLADLALKKSGDVS